jgi:glycosyltransferase involved in cell wall biosynthesis
VIDSDRMRFLFCCDLYYPSVGGVQEVMRQIAERMVQAGHDVTVATKRLSSRAHRVHNGVQIEEFDASGDRVSGLKGEIDRYRAFVGSFAADAIMIKAAHQWSFDACWDLLDGISARKVFIPCGFSQYFNPDYRTYFAELPAILRKFNHLIFYAERYRDVDFARRHAITNFTILPNGASDLEFSVAENPRFRDTLGISQEDFVILTVGSPPDAKGHREVAAAFAKLDTLGREMTLILNGAWSSDEPGTSTPQERSARAASFASRVVEVWQKAGAVGLAKRGWAALSSQRATRRRSAYRTSLDRWVTRARSQAGKRVLQTCLPRDRTIQAFLTADLFVFASTIEYSPLVLFEAAAAGTPFVTAPVGNAEEIVRWTGGGILCPAGRDARGLTRVEPRILAQTIERVIADVELRRKLAHAGRAAWRSTFNWGAIARRYEAILIGRLPQPAERTENAHVLPHWPAGY